jgi:tight adherence protein B
VTRFLAAACAGVAAAAFVAVVLDIDVHLRMMPRRPSFAARVGTWLQQAGSRVSTARFVASSVGVAVIAVIAVAAMTGSYAVAAVPGVAVGALPTAVMSRRRTERLRRVQRAWPDGIRDLLASISSGRSVTHAVGALAAHGPEPLREAFARFPERARAYGTLGALELVKHELADPTSDRVLEVLILAHERGGTIVRAILEDLVDATTRDLKLVEQIETEGLETRINARAVVVLPWLVLVALTARPGPFRDFYRTHSGVLVLAAGALLSAIGLGVLGRLGREPLEPRVFARTDEPR